MYDLMSLLNSHRLGFLAHTPFLRPDGDFRTLEKFAFTVYTNDAKTILGIW